MGKTYSAPQKFESDAHNLLFDSWAKELIGHANFSALVGIGLALAVQPGVEGNGSFPAMFFSLGVNGEMFRR